jgi:ComF family protein
LTILHRVRREFSGLLDLLLPPACPLCGHEQRRDGLCPDCLRGFHPIVTPCCPRCFLPYPAEEGTDHLCEACLREEPSFAWAQALGVYEETLRKAIQHFKYQGAVNLDRPLGLLLAAALEEKAGRFRPDLLIPVPLHQTRLRERTFNQSLLLARVLGKRWHAPVTARFLARIRATPPQQGLKAQIRRHNMKGAFALRGNVAGKRILLVDDVLTTGATVRECSRVLLEGGAAEVAVAVLGRARRNPY